MADIKVKGVLLCGGKGTRLQPATLTTNKHLLAVLNKPMILYPISTLKRLGVTDILLVTGGNHVGAFADFLGDGSAYGVNITYKVQGEAGGIAQALSLAEDYYSGYRGNVVVILGDNIYDNDALFHSFLSGIPVTGLTGESAILFVKEVKDAGRFGVAEIEDGFITNIEEKPEHPKSPYAVTGLYIYPKDVFKILPKLTPSARGELEITDVNNHYVKKGLCSAIKIDGFWSDAGTPDSLYDVIKWSKSVKIK
jgi:glucose-1-phosphate thymidylyltransferase